MNIAVSNMVIRVVEISSGGYKIGKIFASESTYPKDYEKWRSRQVSKSDKI